MRFKHPIDPVGGPLVGFIAAWVLASFALATLHVSPMPKDAFGGKLVTNAEVATASPFTSARCRLVAIRGTDVQGQRDLFLQHRGIYRQQLGQHLLLACAAFEKSTDFIVDRK